MTRTIAEFSPGERNAYVVWNQKLADHTLSKVEHDQARAELDKLFRRGPFAELHLAKAELADLRQRVQILEEYVLTSAAPPAPSVTSTVDEPAPVVRADVTQSVVARDEATASVALDKDPDCGTQSAEPAPEKPKKETRGRKKLRFHPEKDANKRWMILDREADEYTNHGPYKTRREAKEMVDTLNNMPNQPPVPVKDDVPEKWDPAMGNPADVSVTEETPDGGDPLADLGF